jgi:hypothetical protein
MISQPAARQIRKIGPLRTPLFLSEVRKVTWRLPLVTERFYNLLSYLRKTLLIGRRRMNSCPLAEGGSKFCLTWSHRLAWSTRTRRAEVRRRFRRRPLSRVPFSQHCLKIDKKRLFGARLSGSCKSGEAFNRSCLGHDALRAGRALCPSPRPLSPTVSAGRGHSQCEHA